MQWEFQLQLNYKTIIIINQSNNQANIQSTGRNSDSVCAFVYTEGRRPPEAFTCQDIIQAPSALVHEGLGSRGHWPLTIGCEDPSID